MSFPIRDEGPVEHRPALPQACDLAVIGGGVIGICTALYAARQGLRVVVLEKGRVAAEQSSRNWGWIRVQGRDMAEIPVAQESQRLWQELEAECQGRLGLREVGVSYFARTDKDMAGYEAWLAEAQGQGVTSRILSKAEAMAVAGDPVAPWVGALHTPSDLKAEPWVAVPELARLAVASGAVIKERCAVRMLDIEAGRVTGVVTEAGRLRAGQVVLAGGAWSATLLRRHFVSVPQLSVRSTAVATQPMAQPVTGAGVDAKLAFRPRADGGYTLAPAAFSQLYLGWDALRHARRYLPLALSGSFDVALLGPAPKGYPDALTRPGYWRGDEPSPFEAMRILNPEPEADKVGEVVRRFGQMYPQLGPVRVRKAWAGMIDVMPDVVPVVGPVEALPGVIAVTGMCGHGFGAGPGFGRIAADLAAGRDPGVDLSRFRFGRFSDGSPLVPGPNI